MQCPNPNCKDQTMFLDKYDDGKTTLRCYGCDGLFVVECPDQRELVKLIQEE
jgi:hypothetical protein